jgi:hypothetical protein
MISPYALDFSLMLLGAKKKTGANGEILSFKWCKTRVKLHFGNGEEKDFQGEFFISFCSVFT